MAFCMQEISQRTGTGCRVLEVGTGTGHFTCWLAEMSRPGTEIYAFDFSWPIIEKAKINIQVLSEITLFRANARGLLPFENESFDVVFLRLAPLGAHGVPNVQAGYEMLKRGGWYFEAGWEQKRYETPPTEWAMRHGYESVERHEWQYWRTQTEQEQTASQIELEQLAAHECQTAKEVVRPAIKFIFMPRLKINRSPSSGPASTAGRSNHERDHTPGLEWGERQMDSAGDPPASQPTAHQL